MDLTTCSTSLSKIYLFLQSLVAGHFCLSFSRSFIFQIYSFQIVPVVSGDRAIKFGARCTCHVYPQMLFRLQSHNIMIFEFCGSAGQSGCCAVHMQSVREERNEYRNLFPLVTAIWDQKQMSSIPLYRFLCDF